MRLRAFVNVAVVGLLLPQGCSELGCGGGPVPFKAPGAETAIAPSAEGEGSGANDFQPLSSTAFPEGTAEVAVDGARVRPTQASVRAVLPVDLDEDGDRDVLGILEPSEGSPRLFVSRREGRTFEAPGILASAEAMDADCELTQGTVKTISDNYGAAILDYRCGAEASTQHVWIFELAPEPRLLQRLALLPEAGRAAGSVSLSLRTADHDGDGHQDLLVDIAIQTEHMSDPATVALPWVDRPGGLARDPAEPKATLGRMATEAEKALEDKNYDSAADLARGAIALSRALCHSDLSRVRFGKQHGLHCGRLKAVDEALATGALALAKQGHRAQAIAMLLAHEGGDSKQLEQSLVAVAISQGLSTRQLNVSVPSAVSKNSTLSQVGFLSPNTLLVRGAKPVITDLTSGQQQALSTQAGSSAIQDPSGQWTATPIFRSCDGYEVGIAPSFTWGTSRSGSPRGNATKSVLLEAAAPPRGVDCSDPPKSWEKEQGGWQLLGWAPQGLVAHRQLQPRVTPLTSEGNAVGPPTDLPPDAPLPAPLPPGAATSDGHAFAFASPYGIVLKVFAPTEQTRLLRPSGWTPQHADADVAVAPDLSRIAWIHGGQAWLLEGF